MTGRTYVGRTNRSPYKRFSEHRIAQDFMARAINAHEEHFFVILLEKVPTRPPGGFQGSSADVDHVRRRENSWIHRLDTVANGYNSKVELVAPPRLSLPSHGFKVRRISRSRHPQRISSHIWVHKSPSLRRYASRDWQRRWNFLLKLSRRAIALAESYVNKLSHKNIKSMLRFKGLQITQSADVLPFKLLRSMYLKSYPPAEMPSKKVPRLFIVGFTSKLAERVPLRGILMRLNLLSLIPESARLVRNAIYATIPGFKYGSITDKMFLNGPEVGRDLDHDCTCICQFQHWKPYCVKISDGSSCVVTTDMSCLGNHNAAAVLSLQAKFRHEYCPKQTYDEDDEMVEVGEDGELEVSLYSEIERALKDYVYDLCDEFDVGMVHLSEWFEQVLSEISKSLDAAGDVSEYLPLTGHIDFEDAREAFSHLRKSLVFSRVDKAANCISIMCKACYIRIGKAEVEGDGHERIGEPGEHYDAVSKKIMVNQARFLKEEHLPRPRVSARVGKQVLKFPTIKLPTRYLMPKLHKKEIKFRGITTCCATITEGVARMVHACLRGMLPTLHSLWRQVGSKIGIISEECWITNGGIEIIDICREADRVRQARGDDRPHRFETYDFVGMYGNIPLQDLLVQIQGLLDLVFQYQATENGYFSIALEYGFKYDSPYVSEQNCSWSPEQPVEVAAEAADCRKFWIGKDRLFKWIEFVLKEGYVQFGPCLFRQSSGIFMGSSFAPDLANYFAFMHEYTFYEEMINDFHEALEARRIPLYSADFILQYGTRTKRYIDDIITIPLALQAGGLSFGDIIFSGTKLFCERQGSMVNDQWVVDIRGCETLSGMYHKTMWNLDGELIPNTIELTCEQQGESVHFLDMEIVQDSSRTTHIRMYDKRDSMPTLVNYRRFPHVETKLSVRMKYSVLHSQLCRFATRCTKIIFFEIAAAKLMADMIDHSYDVVMLRRKLRNFVLVFFRKTPIFIRESRLESTRKIFWSRVEYEIERRIIYRHFV